jgi:hypothetical protein
MRKLKGSHIKWWHVLGTYLNIWKIVNKPKPIGKCSNMIFIFLANLMIFFWENKSDQIFPFYISHLSKFPNQRRQKKKKQQLVMTCVFECFHCHILKELHEFLHMMGTVTIFEIK